jgi:hypothetical protein
MATNNAINLPLSVINYTNFGTTGTGGFIRPKDTYYTLADEGIAVFYAPLDSEIFAGESFQIISGDAAGWQLVPNSGQLIRWIDATGVMHAADGTSNQRVSSNGLGSNVTATTATVMYVGADLFVITSFTGILTVA